MDQIESCNLDFSKVTSQIKTYVAPRNDNVTSSLFSLVSDDHLGPSDNSDREKHASGEARISNMLMSYYMAFVRHVGEQAAFSGDHLNIQPVNSDPYMWTQQDFFTMIKFIERLKLTKSCILDSVPGGGTQNFMSKFNLEGSKFFLRTLVVEFCW